MPDDSLNDLFNLDLEGRSHEEIEELHAYFERALERLSGASDYSKAVGDLCASWAWLDRALDDLFEPILDCPAEQVACIRNDNTDARCNMLSKLLHTIEIPSEWREWVDGLLTRARGELAKRRNRIVHDAWIVDAKAVKRIDKRSLLRKPGAGEDKALQFDVEHSEDAEKVADLIQCTFTVTQALRYAHWAIAQWRSEGQFPPLDERWLPASKQTAKARYLLGDPEDHPQRLFPVWP